MAVGTAAGVLYAAIDRVLDDMLGAGTLSGTLELLHGLVVTGGLPIVTGACLGLITHSWRERALAIGRERHRAESLRTRLTRVERDQAVWVMAAAVLHEVRNPLHALGLLLDEALAEPGDVQLLSKARGHVDRIASHVQTLRDLPHAGAPEPIAFDLREQVQLICEERRDTCDELGVRVSVGATTTTMVRGDVAFARVILENLIDNAITALRESDGPRALRLQFVLEGAELRLDVHDSGHGIEGDAQALFEPLRTTRARGLGLGLPIARALARSMGGDVVASESAEGATFALRLPSAS